MRQWLRQNTGILIILSLFSALLVFVTVYEPELTLPKIRTEKVPDFSFENVTISHIYDGEMKWQLEADRADVDKGSDRAVMVQAKGRIYENGEQLVSFTSPDAEIHLSESDMVLQRARSRFYIEDRIVHLRSTVLRWFSDVKRFVGTGFVEVESDGIYMTGEDFQVDVPVNLMKISKNATAEIVHE